MRIVNPLLIQVTLNKYRERLTTDEVIELLLSRSPRHFRKRLRVMLHAKQNTRVRPQPIF